ncbi:MAG: MerR family transcriptional regulator [Spirochaetes bacterium]|nr:MerR family transcriptional regulator [Spirochaetota bacterium]MBU1081882.1 MerR family transcriptional regulator [Spirochaetota bacterium]
MKCKIGLFKSWTGVSEGTLRYYEKLGLIQPYRDAYNEYRTYDEVDFLQLIQIKQLSSFDIQLKDLPCEGRAVSIDEMRGMLARRRENLEEEINRLYDQLARIKLHESFFGQEYGGETEIQKANIRGIYRLFISDPAVYRHPAASEISKRWLSNMPYAHATLRIPLKELRSPEGPPYPVSLGIGMLERYFVEARDTFRAPMQYSAPHTCVSGNIVVEDLNRITRKDLEPFFKYFEANSLIPCDDMYGWIVFFARCSEGSRYYISLRVAVA